MKYFLYFISSLLLSLDVFAFVRTRTSTGAKIYWPSNSQTVYVRTSNNNGVASSAIQTVINASLSQWNSNSNISISTSYDQFTEVSSGRNDVYFTTSPSFGSGVLAVTTVSYVRDTGKPAQLKTFSVRLFEHHNSLL